MLTWKILSALTICEFTLASNIPPQFKETLHAVTWSFETEQ